MCLKIARINKAAFLIKDHCSQILRTILLCTGRLGFLAHHLVVHQRALLGVKILVRKEQACFPVNIVRKELLNAQQESFYVNRASGGDCLIKALANAA